MPNEPRGDASRPAPAQPLSRGEFDALAREQWPRVLRFATAFLGDQHLAEDMVQAGLHRLYEHRDRYPLRTHFGPYLVKTVARLCIDQKRGRRADRRRLSLLRPAAGLSASAAVEAAERADLVAEAVAALPERERACFLLTVCEGLSYQEAAEALGFTFSEVNNAIHRARGLLRETLGPLVGERGKGP